MTNKLHYTLIALLLLHLTAFAQTTPTQTQDEGSNHPPSRTCVSDGFVFQNGQLILGVQNGPGVPRDSYGRRGQSILAPRNGSGLLYLIRNNPHGNYSGMTQLLLSHPTNTAMSANWESRLDRGQWSTVTINQPNFVINCFGRGPGAIGYVDCAGVLEVCSYPDSNIGGEGSHWSSENKSLADTMSSLNPMNVRTPKLLSNQ